MPQRVAMKLADDPSVNDAMLDAAIDYLTEKIDQARLRDDPIPYNRYRTRLILETTLRIRQRQM